MRKILFTFLLILIIENTYGSECTQKVASQSEEATNSKSQEPKDISTSQEGATSDSLEEGSPSKSSAESKSGSSQGPSVSPSSSSSKDSTSTSTSTSSTSSINESSDKSSDTQSGSRRLAELLDNEDCKSLKTEDDNKYQCVVSSDHKKCEEVLKENSSRLFLSFIFAIIFIIV